MIGPFGYGHMVDRIPPFGGLGILGLLLFGLLVAAVLAIVFWALTRQAGAKRLTPSAPAPPAPTAADTAREIARQRLARGEIDPEQFRAIIEALSS